MLIPAKAEADTIEAEVVVVGAGPAGISLSLFLSEQGVDVALLSSGSFEPDVSSADLSRAEARPAFHADPAKLEGRRLGGLSWGWGGRCLPLDPLDFEPRPERDLPGWPVARDDLIRHADAAAKFLGIGPAQFSSEDSIEGAALSLERWASQPSLAQKHRLALSANSGPRVFLDINCCGAEIDENGRVTSLKTKTPTGASVLVKGSKYVLAAGGIETARLILWFFEQNGRTAPVWTGRGYMGHLKAQIASLKAPAGIIRTLGYRRDPECFVRNRLALPQKTLTDRKLPNIQFWLDNPSIADPGHGVPGLSLAYLAISAPVIGKRLLPAAMRDYFIGHGKSSSGAHLANIARNPVEALKYCFSVWNGRRTEPVSPGRIAQGRNGLYRLTCAAEERPLFENSIALGQDRDNHGIPRAVIRRKLHPDDVTGLIDANQALSTSIASDSIKMRIDTPESALEERILISSGDGYHQIGTARMGHSAIDSVTDPSCLVHGTRNLFVAGSAVFPRSGQANPTFSIVCLSARLARKILKT